MERNKALIIPGSFALVSGYQGFEGIDIWKKDGSRSIEGTEWIIAHSLGVNYLFTQEIDPEQKIILVNPLIRKQNLLTYFYEEFQFFLKEGTGDVSMVPMRDWLHASLLVLRLIWVDVGASLKKFPSDRISIMKGNRDTYFCDERDIAIARENGNRIYVVDAAHNWNEVIANKVREIIMSNEGRDTKVL